MSQEFTREEIASKFNGANGNPSYVIINGDVLDVTKFAQGHPGGEMNLLIESGKDITEAFYALHRHEVLEKRLGKLKIGNVKGFDKKFNPPSWKDISPVPYAEIDMKAPFWNDSHVRFRKSVREFLFECQAEADELEVSGAIASDELFLKIGRMGLFAIIAGLEYCHYIPEPNLWSRAGIAVKDLDVFHIAIAIWEKARMMTFGFEELTSGGSYGMAPVFKFGLPWTRKDLIPDLLFMRKKICLAITEPLAGSNVAGIKTTARACVENGVPGFRVFGTKKWITNSYFADYLTTLVRTEDEKGKFLGHTMLLIEKSEQVIVKPLWKSASGIGLVLFENCFVPRENVLGRIGNGLELCMTNFNMERWSILWNVVGRNAKIIEESFLWAMHREVFDKKLIEQAVIRNTLGDMIVDHQCVLSQLETLTWQIAHGATQAKLGGSTALLKYKATRMATNVADGSVQIFGGRGVTTTGMGKNIARNFQAFKAGSVAGGSEEIVVDFAVRQAMRSFPKSAKL